jgi:hypothetical protein
MAPKKGFTEIEEYDQANNIVATYIQSLVDKGRGEERRIDVVASHPIPRRAQGSWSYVLMGICRYQETQTAMRGAF